MRRVVLLVAATSCLLLVPGVVWAANSNDVQPAPITATGTSTAPASDPLAAQIQQAEQEQQALAGIKTSLSADISAAQDAQQGLSQLIKTNQETVGLTESKLAIAEQQYRDASVSETRAQAQVQIAKHHEMLDKQILAMTLRSRYTNNPGTMSFLLAGTSFTELIQRADALAHVIKSNGDMVSQVAKDRAEAESAEKQALRDADKAKAAAATLSSESDELRQEISTERGLVSQLSVQTQAAGQEILAADNQGAALAQQIASLRTQQIDEAIAAAEAADWQAANFYITNDLGSLPNSITVSAPTGSGQFIWPARPTTITQGFGPSTLTFEPAFGGYPHFHTGIDLAGALGTPVVAASDGVVVIAAADDTGYGNHIILDHGNAVMTLYGHLEMMGVTAGQAVKQGQLIGLLGSTGNSTGPHLHFEVRVNNQPMDPVPFLPALPQGATGPS